VPNARHRARCGPGRCPLVAWPHAYATIGKLTIPEIKPSHIYELLRPIWIEKRETAKGGDTHRFFVEGLAMEWPHAKLIASQIKLLVGALDWGLRQPGCVRSVTRVVGLDPP